MSLVVTPVRHNENAEKFTIVDFGNLFTKCLMEAPSTMLTAPHQAAEFYTGLCALQPKWRNQYLANQGHAGVDSVHLHGEYGFVFIVTGGFENPAAMMISKSWCVTEDNPALFCNAIGLLRECMRLQIPADTLVQWFDTMCRRGNGKRTSPHFDPEHALHKITHRVKSMIELMNDRQENFSTVFQPFLSRNK